MIGKTILPSGIPKSGIAYNPPLLTGQTTSYQTGDDGWHLANGTYNYTAPLYPVSYARLDRAATYPFITLVSNNSFGNKYRFTSITGGYYDQATATYYTVLGVPTTFLSEFTNGIVVDHLTRLAWFRPDQTSRNWSTSITNIHGVSTFGYSDWRLCNKNEYNTLLNSEINGGTNYEPIVSIIGTSTSAQSWTSTTRQDLTTDAMWWALYSQQRLLTNAKTGTARVTYCRNWLT